MLLVAADPYLISALSAGSALAGVLASSIVQLLAARSMRKSQREVLEMQGRQDQARQLRDERRLAFAQFLSAANTCYHYSSTFRMDPVSPNLATAKELAGYLLKLESEADVAIILSSEGVRDAIRDLTAFLRAYVIASLAGEPLPEDSDTLWNNVGDAMKTDLKTPIY